MNAKKELMGYLNKGIKVSCWHIFADEAMGEKISMDSILKKGYTEEEFNHELDKLDYEYDDGYGCQELFGTVLFTDGSWLERNEYDGSENWMWTTAPTLPECE
jgi:hypothetical protein